MLLNAVVNGCADLAQRVTLRDALGDLGFIEITRPLISMDGDDIDVQIAIFDQGLAPTSASSARLARTST